MAPFTPFLADELYIKLTGGESVHLRGWPATGHVNELALERMAYVREIINEGLSQRAAAGIKVRQPLQVLSIKGCPPFVDEMEDEYTAILQEELNVKAVRYNTQRAEHEVRLDTKLTPGLKREGMMREVVRNVQNARKQAGLNVDDRIKLSLSTTDKELHKAIDEHREAIASETLATEVVLDQTLAFETACSVEDAPLTVSLEKAKG
jgi:isoleucyl-tRNA synthetase